MAGKASKAIGGFIAILVVAIGIYASQSGADIGLAGYERKLSSTALTTSTNKSASVSCPEGKVVSGGGYAVTGTNPGTISVYVNGPNSSGAWVVVAKRSVASTKAWGLTAAVLCANGDAPTATETPLVTPTPEPTTAPTDEPTEAPTDAPTEAPTDAPTEAPTEAPTDAPTEAPTEAPTDSPAP